MADSDREFKVRITGDASSLVQSSRESADALGSVASATNIEAAQEWLAEEQKLIAALLQIAQENQKQNDPPDQ